MSTIYVNADAATLSYLWWFVITLTPSVSTLHHREVVTFLLQVNMFSTRFIVISTSFMHLK